MAHSFQSVSSMAVRHRLSSSLDAKKPYVTATFTSLTVSFNAFVSFLSLLIVIFLADVVRRCRRCGQQQYPV